MARPRKMQRLNDKKSSVIAENILKQDPEGLSQAEQSVQEKVILFKHIPEMREAIFINNRDPGYPLDFHYSSGTHPLKVYKLFHGHTYTLPVEVIEHLESCNEPQYGYRKNIYGYPEHYIVSRKYIFQFRTANTSIKAA